MYSLSKLTTLGSVLVASLAYADTINLVTTSAGLGANDSVIWSPQLGADGATIPNPFAATSTGARAVGGTFATTTGLVAKVCSGCSWSPLTGDFTNNDFVVWSFDNTTSSGTGAVTLTFPSLSGVGAVIQADALGQFTAKIELFNGVTSLGFVTRTSNAAGDAIFIGALDITAPNANKAVISLTASQNSGTPNFLGDFAMGPLSMNAPAAILSSVPTKSFSPTSIAFAGTSVVTVALSNTNASSLTGGAFTDTLVNMSAVGGAVGGTCSGTTPNTLVAGATNLSFSGITIPPGGCTVTFSVTSSTVGVNPNSTSGVTTTQAAAGAGSNTANLTVAALVSSVPTKSFSPTSIAFAGTSVVTVALSNANTSSLTGGAFTDTLVNMSTVGGAVGGTCAGTTPNTLVAGATNLSFTGITIPAGGCTVTFSVTSSTSGVNPNSTSGVTTTQAAAGAASNTANLTVAAPVSSVLTKSFSPTSIGVGGTSVVTVALSNANTTSLTGGSFTDTLVNMSAVGGAVGGTCSGTTPNTLVAGATNLSFSGITIPPGGCTVTFSVTSSTVGVNPNTTSGVTTTQTPVAGVGSNTANLTVTLNLTYQVLYASNLQATGGDSYINISNPGIFSNGSINSGTTPVVVGSLCANIYAFGPDEEILSCCSCPVTPNGLVSLSAKNDLMNNTLGRFTPNSIVIKIVATLPSTSTATSCANSAAIIGTATQGIPVSNGLVAWGTTLHANTAPLDTGHFGLTENPFTPSTLSAGEINRLNTLCNFAQVQGSLHGICNSCAAGGLGGAKQ